MSLFSVGSVYRGIYQIEQVVTFFNGELAIASANGKRFYLQASLLHREAPARALQQYRNLQHSLVLPYIDVFVDGSHMVFVRPYIPLRPLREVIMSQEISEKQVVEWGRQLLELEANLRSKPLPMYLLLDPRNIGIDPDGKLQVMFCGLEYMMKVESSLDWGTFFYSIFSGQYLDGPILKLPKDFAGSKPLAKLIQKTIRVYDVDVVLEQVNQYLKKQESGSLLKRFLGEKKMVSSPDVPEQSIERDTALPSPSPTGSSSQPSFPSTQEEKKEEEELYQELEVLLQRTTSKEESYSEMEQQEEQWAELDQVQREKISEPSLEEESKPLENMEKDIDDDEKTGISMEPKVNSRPVTPAMIALEEIDLGDLSNSFVFSLERERKEFELRRQERIAQLRRELEKREKELIEQKQKEFAELEQKILEEQRKKEQQILLKEQQILEREWRKRLEQKKKERLRRKILEQIRKKWEEEEQALLQKEHESFLKREQELIEEFERKKGELLKRLREEFEERIQQKIESLRKEWAEKEKLLVEKELMDQHHILLPEEASDEQRDESKPILEEVQQSSAVIDAEIVEVIPLEEEECKGQEELEKFEGKEDRNEPSSGDDPFGRPDYKLSRSERKRQARDAMLKQSRENKKKQAAKNDRLKKNEKEIDEISLTASDEQEKLAKQFEEYMNFFYKKT